MIAARPKPGLAGFRRAARALLASGARPEEVTWVDPEEGQEPLFADGGAAPPEAPAGFEPKVPRAFVDRARWAIHHRAPGRLALLYRLLWRLTHGEPHLMKVPIDDDVLALERMAKAVRRDAHKTKAFVRFRRLEVAPAAGGAPETWYVAWHRPDHRVLPRVASFFRDRFRDQRWAILTPDASLSWDLERLASGPGVPRTEAPAGDALEELWRTYYGSIFNPARLKIRAMKAELPVRHWATLPEAVLIPELVREARGRTEEMMALDHPHASEFMPENGSLADLARAVDGCRACPLYENATQGVFGAGAADARLMLIGEQPGDEEDKTGEPFVGPAGRVLDKALEEVGIAREEVWITNSVKHFKHEMRGKFRLHKTPSMTEVRACLPWLEEELRRVEPEALVCLGATAAKALFGSSFRITKQRGEPIETRWAPWAIATYHPSALLRMPEESMRDEARAAFVADLRQAAARLASRA